MRLGTTPKHTFTFPFDVSKIANVKITYSQAGRIILEKYLKDCNVEGQTLTLTLTQEDTFLFMENKSVEIQARVVTLGGEVLASDVVRVLVERCLDEEVLQ